MQRPSVLFFVASVLLTSLASAQIPNVILIVADDLGYGDLGCYGQQTVKTENLDRMASEGMLFTDFYAGSTVCAPSRCVLMTGLHTGHAFIRGNDQKSLRSFDVTIPRVLTSTRMRTGLIGKWGLGQEGTTGTPNRQGFQSFFGYLDQKHAHNFWPSFLVRDEERVALTNVVPNETKRGAGVASVRTQYSHDLFTEEALTFLDRNRRRPFFLTLAYTIPHANNEAGKAGMEVPDLGAYAERDWPLPQKAFAAMVQRLDADVGRLLARVKAHGLDERTLVLFTSDNGPHAEGGNDPKFFQSSGPLRGIKRSLHEGGIRVPLLARWPGTIAAGSRTAHLAGFQDVLPTLAELAGVPAKKDIDGISFVETLRGREDLQRRHEALYFEFHERGGSQAVRFGPYKAIRAPIATGPVKLYDLRTDLHEDHDLAAERPKLVARATALLNAHHQPPERDVYMGRRIAPTMHWTGADWLERTTREREESASVMLKQLGVKPGDVVCDFGSGSGYHSLPLAKSVGARGRVVAVDIQPEMLQRLERRAADALITNIECITSTPYDTRLEPKSLDLVLMVDVYHELTLPELTLRQIRGALKPKGRLVLVEYRAEDASVPIKPLHKMSKDQVIKEMNANGFVLENSFDELPWQHLLTFVAASR